jgi:hypothetical protein
MDKDEALDLALEALEESLYATTAKSQFLAFEAITAIKQARALDKKAENARELGLDYEPVPENFIDALKFDVAMREWVGLTDEEKNEITWGKTVYEILELAEAKLKEKNCADH